MIHSSSFPRKLTCDPCRRDDVISLNNDGVREEYIKRFRDTHVADYMSRFVCNGSEPQGHRQYCFCCVGQFMRYLKPQSTNGTDLEQGFGVVDFQWRATSRHRVLEKRVGVRHGARELGCPRAGGLKKFQTRT